MHAALPISLCAVALAGCGRSSRVCDIDDLPADMTLEELDALGRYNLGLLNADRAAFSTESDGARDLVWSDELFRVAVCHAQDMCQRQFFDHTNPDGDGPGDRIESSTGLRFGEDFFTWSENVAYGSDAAIDNTSGPEQLEWVMWRHHQGYMDECQCGPGCDSGKIAGHRANILNPDFTEVGIGEYYCAEDQRFYNAQNFWRRDETQRQTNATCEDDFTADPPDPYTSVAEPPR